MLQRITYRTRQFWNTLTTAPAQPDLDQARLLLNQDLFALFQSLQTGEQAHALQVYNKIKKNGSTNQDLLQAALLHDIGKARIHLNILDRVVIVLTRALLPEKVQQWGHGEPTGWRRPFVVAEQHPAWGADMATVHGASPMTVNLIRRHQEVLSEQVSSLEDKLLIKLQEADDVS